MNARTLPFGPPGHDGHDGHDGPDETTDIAIIGTGFAGLGMAIRLRQTGATDFVV
ncbi:4-hydroxyacetophenone monooxygenase, partial [Burkholderia sp. SIMBA_057]